jgi:hypothetical protein
MGFAFPFSLFPLTFPLPKGLLTMPLPGYKPILTLEYKNGDDLSKEKRSIFVRFGIHN